MKKVYIFVVGIILFILFLSIPINPSVSQKDMMEIIDSYKIIEKNIKSNNNLYVIYDNKIILKNKEVYSDNEIIGEGKFVKTGFNYIYGFLNYKGYCLKKEYNSKINIKSGKCDEIVLPDTAYKVIEKNSTDGQLKDDNFNFTSNLYNSKKYFVGQNPNNYIIFSNNCWRIVNIASNNSLKIVYEGKTQDNNCENISTNISGNIGLFTWDNDKNKTGNWDRQSYLKERMDYWGESGLIDTKQVIIKLDNDYIEEVHWNIGTVNSENKTIKEDIFDEQSIVTEDTHKIGLLNVSDYSKISCDSSANLSTKRCGINNYLYKSKYNWWTINISDNSKKNTWVVMQDGTIKNTPIKLSNEYFFSGTRAVIYLKKDIKLIGNGTQTTPYIIVK